MMRNLLGVFSSPNESLPFNTNIVATIRTDNNDPVYSKLYPYPMGVADFVNSEIRNLLKNGIIRPSRSPYNNPIWVVDKKGKDEHGNINKRLVIDFRKLNQKTIDDRYPIPDVTVILSNLGKARFFTTLDLKSGFHQISLAEQDREKTAFSVGNGKYEFCRLPFGLKNAPSIFQRAIDDVLREQIGKTCYVYVDDVIIFSENESDHVDHIAWVLDKLHKANMRVSREKSHFFKESVEYLGFVVTRNGIKTSPDKVRAIRDYEQPTTLFNVRSFLGLASYYRCFIKDFASIAKPLTDILKGDNGKISAHQSKKIKVDFNENQVQAFNKLKAILSSEEVMLLYPDFKKPFDLTTDASSLGLGAVLSQGGRPITMISRTLKDRELNFATNERELLAIVWALQKLRNYLYGVKDLNIYTDHQPLTFAVSDRNPNAKIKRWKSFVDEHNAKIFHKPGKENYVADALSRQNIHALEEEEVLSDIATVHSEVSFTYTIEATDKPLNCFRNQIVLEEASFAHKRNFILFTEKIRHMIEFTDKNTLIDEVKLAVNPGVVNAIHCDLPTLACIQHELVRSFPTTKFWHCRKMVLDIFDKNEQMEIVNTEHNRAHRAAQENVKQILEDYYFPKMTKLANEIVANCRICTRAKYDRHPRVQEMGETPIPSYVGEMLHIDIFSTDKKHFLTCVDKFSKFAVVQPIQSRTIIDLKIPIMQLMNLFPDTKSIYCDNEPSLKSETITSMLRNQFCVEVANAPPLHSTSNGQVERFHSTLTEIARCLKLERNIDSTIELIMLATAKYNRTIHSTINRKPIDVVHSSTIEIRKEIKDKIIKAQRDQLDRHNPSRQSRTFNVGDRVLVKNNKRLGNKLTPLYTEERVEADLGTTVLIRGRVVHKDNLRILLLVLPLWRVTSKLTDYSNSDYIPIVDGNVIIWQDFDYLQHTTNLTVFSEMADETKHLTSHFPSSHMIKILDSDIARIKTILASLNIHHRHARSINILGTALKVVAGTPDFDDFETVRFKQRELIESENRQIGINTKTQAQINQLTETVNVIIKNSKAKQIDTGHLYETLLARNRIIISELETLMLAITLAKIGIINPALLDSADLNKIINIKPSTNITVTDLMEVSYIKVLLDENYLVFFIKYPRIKLECKKIIILPVQHNQTILHLGTDNNIADCGNKMIPIGSCTTTLTSTFCKELMHTTCAQQLHSGGVAHCSTRPSHLEPLVVVDDGIIVINDNTAVIKTVENSEQLVTGTYLLTFDSEIYVNGSAYKNLKGELKMVPNPAAASILNITGHQEILSLPYLRRMGIENLRHISQVESKLIVGPIVSILVVIGILLAYSLMLKLYQNRLKKRQGLIFQATIDTLRRPEDGSQLREGGVNVNDVNP
ncbi:Retrovirus-related Pol polyprotein from transposon gypsy [Eumeta japonica]|uniref:RNA-directed DNA polymerase n=1 Tax=Eumeta variegata TaxID=151549 RepID=A0A4C2ACT2_EUMVA|nr:Retrovirus-related Pol polyprotein from transposon gypsy [Eumeta japonica]